MAAKKSADAAPPKPASKPSKSKKAKPVEAVAVAPTVPAPAPAPAPTHDEIAARASALYAAGGRNHVANWLTAERELTEALKG